MGKKKGIGIAGLVAALGVGAVAVWGLWSGPADAAAPVVTMYKSPGCSCCNGWREHMEEAGFRVETVSSDRVSVVKAEKRVPFELSSCHTAVVEGHVVEGHVPADAVWRMLREEDGPYGIGVPGMPAGSPGMPGGPEAYDVMSFEPGRVTGVWASY